MVGLAVLVAAFIHPLAVLPLILLAVPFGSILRAAPDPSADTQTTELAIGATELLVGVLGAAWLARGVRRRELDIRASAPVAALLALLVLAMLSIGYADDRLAAIKETVKWVELVLVLLVVVDLVREPSTVRWVLAPLFVAGAAEAAYGAVQFATGSGPETFALQGALRAFGHFEQPNPFAGYLTTILPMAILMALTPANPAWFRWLALVSSGLLAVGIGLSQSRGAWLGAAAATVVLVALWSRTTRRLLLPAAFLGAILLAMASANLLPPSVFDRVAQAVEYFGIFDVRTVDPTSANFAVLERMAHWQAGWYMFLDQPWFGVGAGNYGDGVRELLPPRLARGARTCAQLLPEHARRAGRAGRRTAARGAGAQLPRPAPAAGRAVRIARPPSGAPCWPARSAAWWSSACITCSTACSSTVCRCKSACSSGWASWPSSTSRTAPREARARSRVAEAETEDVKAPALGQRFLNVRTLRFVRARLRHPGLSGHPRPDRRGWHLRAALDGQSMAARRPRWPPSMPPFQFARCAGAVCWATRSRA